MAAKRSNENFRRSEKIIDKLQKRANKTLQRDEQIKKFLTVKESGPTFVCKSCTKLCYRVNTTKLLPILQKYHILKRTFL